MLTKLTEEQINHLDVIKDKWIARGLSTERFNLDVAKEVLYPIYDYILLKLRPKTILIFDNPLLAWNAIGNSNQVWNQVVNQVENQVENQVLKQVWNQVRNQVRNQAPNFVWPYLDGNFFAHYCAWIESYQYLGVKDLPSNNILDAFKNQYKLSLIYPLDNGTCILSQKPTSIVMKKGILHNDNGPAITYDPPGDFNIYALNGVKVSKEIVETPFDKLDANIILKTSNVEVRREIVRKIGIERVCKDLKAKVIDSGLDAAGQPCELLSLNIGDNRFRPYIKILNPSIGIYHIEGVSPECDTIEKAFTFRNGTSEKPVKIS